MENRKKFEDVELQGLLTKMIRKHKNNSPSNWVLVNKLFSIGYERIWILIVHIYWFRFVTSFLVISFKYKWAGEHAETVLQIQVTHKIWYVIFLGFVHPLIELEIKLY